MFKKKTAPAKPEKEKPVKVFEKKKPNQEELVEPPAPVAIQPKPSIPEPKLKPVAILTLSLDRSGSKLLNVESDKIKRVEVPASLAYALITLFSGEKVCVYGDRALFDDLKEISRENANLPAR